LISKKKEIVTSGEEKIRIYDIQTGQIKCEKNIGAKINCMWVDSRFIITGSREDNTIAIWKTEDIREGKDTNPVIIQVGPISAIYCLGPVLFYGLFDGGLGIADMRQPKPVALQAHEDSIVDLAFYEGVIATASRDKTVKLYALVTAKCLCSWKLPSIPTCLQFDRDKLIVGCSDGFARLIDLATMKVVKQLQHAHPVSCLKFKDNILVTGCDVDGWANISTKICNFGHENVGTVGLYKWKEKKGSQNEDETTGRENDDKQAFFFEFTEPREKKKINITTKYFNFFLSRCTVVHLTHIAWIYRSSFRASV